MTSIIDYTLSHQNYKSILEDTDFDIRKNMDILLTEPDTVNVPNEEIVARYVINLISIRKELMNDSELLSKSPYTIKICRNYPFLSEISGQQFFYVAQGTMPQENSIDA